MLHDRVQHIRWEGRHSIQLRGSAVIVKDTDEEDGGGGGCWTAGNGAMFACSHEISDTSSIDCLSRCLTRKTLTASHSY